MKESLLVGCLQERSPQADRINLTSIDLMEAWTNCDCTYICKYGHAPPMPGTARASYVCTCVYIVGKA
jgi:hypothetical protein